MAAIDPRIENTQPLERSRLTRTPLLWGDRGAGRNRVGPPWCWSLFKRESASWQRVFSVRRNSRNAESCQPFFFYWTTPRDPAFGKRAGSAGLDAPPHQG